MVGIDGETSATAGTGPQPGEPQTSQPSIPWILRGVATAAVYLALFVRPPISTFTGQRLKRRKMLSAEASAAWKRVYAENRVGRTRLSWTSRVAIPPALALLVLAASGWLSLRVAPDPPGRLSGRSRPGHGRAAHRGDVPRGLRDGRLA